MSLAIQQHLNALRAGTPTFAQNGQVKGWQSASAANIALADEIEKLSERAGFVENLALMPLDPSQMNYDAINTLYSRGALPKALKQSAVKSIRTLRDVVAIAREMTGIQGPDPVQDGIEDGA